ncbi:prepilin-type N-terminal cleavage/methylation domain-containing protein [Bdellovibrio sp. 22V]|uniref:prepilin-type N-terminal cleavage/methylation domain-containing protein n=1 Tax=Bdellovibrio TaxID=958 RepID=UPI0025432862|nr:prepilin-type N-terminal cleavage/methylation domain-containing protein [Bdellovibrio sp. 22V]WII72310.1 prepilin-type N-terminal cleavage/methylation domain-containing protein [Bdellovibrio sp. 22V]
MRLNQKGFSLAEMVVGVALLGIMGMVAASFFVFTAKQKEEITNEIEDKVDNIIAERMLLKDLKNSEPSFNNLVVTDDYGRPFFDYVSDVTDISVDQAERKLTLQLGRRNELIFLVSAEKLPTLMYTPATAYDMSNVNGNPFKAADLTFRSLNKNNEVYKASNGALWGVGTILMLDSPAAVREMTPLGPNYNRPARSPIFVGVVTAAGESRLNPVMLPNFLNRTHPMYPNETIKDEDSFLRDIPPMGGAAPLVRLKAVRIIKYYLAKESKGNKINLWRSSFNGRDFDQGQLFAADVTGVEFSRKDAHDSLIYYKIMRPDKSGK